MFRSEFWFARVLETFGGALLLVGLFARPVAFLLAGEMVVVYFQFSEPISFWTVANNGVAAALYALPVALLFRCRRRTVEPGCDPGQEEVSMRKVVAAEYLTLDGVTQDPGPSGDFEHRGWTVPYWNDELLRYQSDLLFASDSLLLGRVTYEEFVAAWPLRSGDPFTDRMNSLPKFVASTSLRGPLKWNATLLTGDVADEVTRLKKQPGQNLLIYGSGELVKTLMQRNLIDIYRLMLYPIVLGSGERFFRGGIGTMLSLSDAKTTTAGVAVLTYVPRSKDQR